MKICLFLNIIALSFGMGGLLSAQSGLDPLKPDSPLTGYLHTQADDQSPAFRELKPTDRVRILRSEGVWYEVDVTSEKGIDFRGWVKGELAPERKEIENPGEIMKAPKQNPLRSDRFFWFWSGDIEETAQVSFFLGGENLSFSPKGTPTGGVKSISGYKFFGFSLGTEAALSILETELFNREFRWILDGAYHYGFFQVAFGNSPSLPGEIQGVSYRIHTQQFEIATKAELRLMRWSQGFLKARLGAGFFLFDDSPDLKRTNRGNVVFSQISFSGIISPLELEAQFKNNYRILFSFSPLWLPSVSENPDASATGNLKSDGLNWRAKSRFQYRFSPLVSFDGGADYFSATAKHPGSSRRIDSDFTNVKIKLSSIRLVAGAGLHF